MNATTREQLKLAKEFLAHAVEALDSARGFEHDAGYAADIEDIRQDVAAARKYVAEMIPAQAHARAGR